MDVQDDKVQKQHFVPEIYLKQFADGKGYFFQANIEHIIKYKEKGGLKRVNTGQVCYEKDFYDIGKDDLPHLPVTIDDKRFLEKFAFRYERNIGSVFEIFKSRSLYILKKELAFLIDAYLSIKQRNVYVRKKLFGDREMMSRTLDESIRTVRNYSIVQHFIQQGYDVEGIFDRYKEDYLENSRRDELGHKEFLLSSALGTSQARNDTSNAILCHDFFVLEAGEGDYFLMTDNPGYTSKLYEGRPAVYNTDFLNYETIVMPLNSKQVLVFDGRSSNRRYLVDPLRKIRYAKVDSNVVEKINRELIFIINSRIFCENEAFLKRMIDRTEFSYTSKDAEKKM